MIRKFYFCFLLGSLLTACGGSMKTDVLGSSENVKNEIETISTCMMPLLFDSTTVLLHCGGQIINMPQKQNSGSVFSKEVITDGLNSDICYMSKDEIIGRIDKVDFEDCRTNQTRMVMIGGNAIITSIKYLRNIKKQLGVDLLLYQLEPINQEERIRDSKSPILFFSISKLDGSNYTSLIPEMQIYRDSKMIEGVSRFYFSTYKDVNNNEKFDSKDEQYYYYIDFEKDPFKVQEYNPIVKNIDL